MPLHLIAWRGEGCRHARRGPRTRRVAGMPSSATLSRQPNPGAKSGVEAGVGAQHGAAGKVKSRLWRSMPPAPST